MFEGEMFIKIQPTTLLQIFWEFMFDSEVILKSVEGPDDSSQDLQARKG